MCAYVPRHARYIATSSLSLVLLPLSLWGQRERCAQESFLAGGPQGLVRTTYAASVPFVMRSHETVVVTTDDVPGSEHVVTTLAPPRVDRLFRPGDRYCQVSDRSRRTRSRSTRYTVCYNVFYMRGSRMATWLPIPLTLCYEPGGARFARVGLSFQVGRPFVGQIFTPVPLF